jgi:hypothetical protein
MHGLQRAGRAGLREQRQGLLAVLDMCDNICDSMCDMRDNVCDKT